MGDADARGTGTACFGKVACISKIRAALGGLARPSRPLAPCVRSSGLCFLLLIEPRAGGIEFAAMFERPGA